MEVVSANMARKRKHLGNESTLETRGSAIPRDWSKTQNGTLWNQRTNTNESIRWDQVWDLGNEVIVLFCLLVLTVLRDTLHRALYLLSQLKD
jgi:hypothetical protein